MLTDRDIQQALKASRVVPVTTANPHGPLGLAQLSAEVAGIRQPATVTIPVRAETWAKLQHLADVEGQAAARPVTVEEVAAAIVERFIASQPS
jgi:hypothetical protein